MFYRSIINNLITIFKYTRKKNLILAIVIAEGMQVITPQKSNLRSVR
jgi:hypothetical protein